MLGAPDKGREYMVLVEDPCVDGPCADRSSYYKVVTI